jgi:hypothetical protein
LFIHYINTKHKMSSLEQNEQIVTYAAFAPEESDGSSKGKLDAYVWEHLPLDTVQKQEFARLLRADHPGGDGDRVCSGSGNAVE